MRVAVVGWAVLNRLLARASLGVPGPVWSAELWQTLASLGIEAVVEANCASAMLREAITAASVPVHVIVARLVGCAQARASHVVEVLCV